MGCSGEGPNDERGANHAITTDANPTATDPAPPAPGPRPEEAEQAEEVEHPAYYHASSGVEVIAAIEAWGLGFALGSALKYIARAGRKPGADALVDLRKARFYLDREIGRMEGERNSRAAAGTVAVAPGTV